MALVWNDVELQKQVIAAIIDGVTEFGLTHEKEAKSILQPKGRGVLTGTLRRSIHAANPSYNFGGDDVPPTPNSPERGGGVDVKPIGARVAVSVGSGMTYAMAMEQRYGYITNSHGRIIAKLPDFIKKHAGRRGLL